MIPADDDNVNEECDWPNWTNKSADKRGEWRLIWENKDKVNETDVDQASQVTITSMKQEIAQLNKWRYRQTRRA